MRIIGHLAVAGELMIEFGLFAANIIWNDIVWGPLLSKIDIISKSMKR